MVSRYPLGRFCATAATVLWTVALASAQSAPTVDVGYARYQGFVDGATNITQFLGIRYAAPPIGDLRFSAPQHPANETGLQLATFQPNWCMQSGDGTSPTNPLRKREAALAPEDCLFLNVYYPSDGVGTPRRTLLPTVVWIHGGGYIAGAAIGASGEDVVLRANKGVVVVVIQYRLGVVGKSLALQHHIRTIELTIIGFLAVDQEFALRWVNQHVCGFGVGDPSKVTIWGESAGAGSVLQHVIANGGQTKPQLFRGAITSSTFLPSQYRYDDYFPEVLCCTSAKDSMACLRAVDPSVLATVNANINNAGFYGTFTTVPVVDGAFITQRPTLSLLEGKVNGEALLAVTNTFEGVDFVNQSVSTTATQYSYDLFPGFSDIQSRIVGALYGGLGTDSFQVNAIQGESIFICPTYYLLNAFRGRAFKGEFAVPPGLHSDDYAYYWPNGVAPPFNNTDFIDAFAQTFTSFIVNLDPNHKLAPTVLPKWNKYDVLNTEMLFNKTVNDQPVVRPTMTSNTLLERCLFWESVGSLTGQ
ncbi:alpha/beta-hydrolase [Mycena albidolilacea]|uniref:Alpha/beta-hydrolase n=1 Tax=Mycena albidolilacea TaxID=1033008 RepID=A0AAD7A8C4_9AGAR|nr:alpha/beta-hydrolase [Mycena albidolilacea]